LTIAVLVKVNDGLVFASDSAATVTQTLPTGQLGVVNIYNNANKIFNLHKGLPIGAMSAGLGNIGSASISTLAKDLRQLFSSDSETHPDWKLDRSSYSMDEVVQRVKTFFYDEHYQPYIASIPNAAALPLQQTAFYLLIGGYDGPAGNPKTYSMTLTPNGCQGPDEVTPSPDGGVTCNGQPEAVSRLLMGVSTDMPQALMNLGVAQQESVRYTEAIKAQVQAQIVNAGMPIKDAIDLAEFLVQVTIGYVRFCPGGPTVGGPIEVAAVTRHEGFKWVQRKHYYDVKLNPVSD
jgi:hypothetical protein